MKKNPIAEIKMESGHTIKIELYPETAPNTVHNFIWLANSKYFKGLIFHRVISGFVIQGGSPDGTSEGGPDYTIKGEFSSNGFKNDLKHTEGVISMARDNNPDTAGSQFFIMHKPAPRLDGNYAAFGKVIEGMDEIDRIATVNTDENDRPVAPEKIEEITVNCFGIAYPEPEKIKI